MSENLVYSYIEDIAKRIHEPSLYGAASVMIGAGFSKNAEAVDEGKFAPNWEELAREMFNVLYPSYEGDDNDKLRIQKTSGSNVLKLAEEFKVVFGRNKLERFIEKSIDDDNFLPSELHIKLLNLNWKDAFTTNYDTLLERAIDNVDRNPNYKILTSQNDLPGSNHPRIIKLHGCVKSAKHYIICEEDYRTYPIKFAPLVNTVQQAMLETQLCLIGFSGDDPNFLSWVGWLRDNMGDHAPTIYLIGLFNHMGESEKMMLSNQNITIVDLKYLCDGETNHKRALKAFLKKIEAYGKTKTKVLSPFPFEYIYKRDDLNSFLDNMDYIEVMKRYLQKLNSEVNEYVFIPNPGLFT